MAASTSVLKLSQGANFAAERRNRQPAGAGARTRSGFVGMLLSCGGGLVAGFTIGMVAAFMCVAGVGC